MFFLIFNGVYGAISFKFFYSLDTYLHYSFNLSPMIYLYKFTTYNTDGFQVFNYFLFLTDGILGASELRGPVNYKYNVLKSATKNFSEENKLGEGGFGEVYKV